MQICCVLGFASLRTRGGCLREVCDIPHGTAYLVQVYTSCSGSSVGHVSWHSLQRLGVHAYIESWNPFTSILTCLSWENGLGRSRVRRKRVDDIVYPHDEVAVPCDIRTSNLLMSNR